MARHIFANLQNSKVLLIGAGDTSELVAQHFKQQGVSEIIVANRTLQRAREMAERVGATAHSLSELSELLPQADIVVSSTASTLPIVGKGSIEKALKKRRHRPMLLIDLAVPRDIEEQVNELDDASFIPWMTCKALLAKTFVTVNRRRVRRKSLSSSRLKSLMTG